MSTKTVFETLAAEINALRGPPVVAIDGVPVQTQADELNGRESAAVTQSSPNRHLVRVQPTASGIGLGRSRYRSIPTGGNYAR